MCVYLILEYADSKMTQSVVQKKNEQNIKKIDENSVPHFLENMFRADIELWNSGLGNNTGWSCFCIKTVGEYQEMLPTIVHR